MVRITFVADRPAVAWRRSLIAEPLVVTDESAAGAARPARRTVFAGVLGSAESAWTCIRWTPLADVSYAMNAFWCADAVEIR
jgi:hypothetical protein